MRVFVTNGPCVGGSVDTSTEKGRREKRKRWRESDGYEERATMSTTRRISDDDKVDG